MGCGSRGFPQAGEFSTESYPQVWISMWIIPFYGASRLLDLDFPCGKLLPTGQKTPPSLCKEQGQGLQRTGMKQGVFHGKCNIPVPGRVPGLSARERGCEVFTLPFFQCDCLILYHIFLTISNQTIPF